MNKQLDVDLIKIIIEFFLYKKMTDNEIMTGDYGDLNKKKNTTDNRK